MRPGPVRTLKTGALAWALAGACALAAEPTAITVHFHFRPPYMVTQPDGSPAGLTASGVKQAFEAINQPVRWVETPAARQLMLIEANSGRDCGIGWFKNPQREAFARFSAPIYRDLPWVIVAGKQFKLTHGATVAQTLAGKDTRLLVKDKYSYGAELDGKIAQFGGERLTTSGDWSQMLGMLSLARADFMFASHEEADYFLESEKASAAGLRVITLADAPAGEFRYLMCSKQVQESELASFSAALSAARRR